MSHLLSGKCHVSLPDRRGQRIKREFLGITASAIKLSAYLETLYGHKDRRQRSSHFEQLENFEL
jgi:hypothetical protein